MQARAGKGASCSQPEVSKRWLPARALSVTGRDPHQDCHCGLPRCHGLPRPPSHHRAALVLQGGERPRSVHNPRRTHPAGRPVIPGERSRAEFGLNSNRLGAGRSISASSTPPIFGFSRRRGIVNAAEIRNQVGVPVLSKVSPLVGSLRRPPARNVPMDTSPTTQVREQRLTRRWQSVSKRCVTGGKTMLQRLPLATLLPPAS